MANTSLRLFDVNEANGYTVVLNKEWIQLIPRLNAILKADKGSDGDYRGDKKLWATKQFTYIFHLLDPRTPIENAEVLGFGERRRKAIEYAQITEKEASSEIMLDAVEEYEYMLEIAVPSLPMLRAAKNSLVKVQTHFDNIDFDARDKKGALVHDVSKHITNVKNLKQLHLAVKEFDAMVMEELKQSTGIRGTADMGDREDGRRKRPAWNEGALRSSAIDQQNIEDEEERMEDIFEGD